MSQILPIVGAFGGVAAIAGAIAVLLKVGPERTDVKIGSAEKVMFGQDRFIEQLEASVEKCVMRTSDLAAQVDQLRTELRAVTDERDRLREENSELRGRVGELERRVEDLSNGRGRRK